MSDAQSKTPDGRNPKRSFARGLVFGLPIAMVLWAIIGMLM
jgi:hypothetical protein